MLGGCWGVWRELHEGCAGVEVAGQRLGEKVFGERDGVGWWVRLTPTTPQTLAEHRARDRRETAKGPVKASARSTDRAASRPARPPTRARAGCLEELGQTLPRAVVGAVGAQHVQAVEAEVRLHGAQRLDLGIWGFSGFFRVSWGFQGV